MNRSFDFPFDDFSVNPETGVAHLYRDQLPQSLDVLLLLQLHVAPQLLQSLSLFGVGKILVIATHRIAATAQLVDQVMIVIAAAK
ncbi:hypothetical protein [Lacipirellula parvula]|uniref:hypothetical protein n=1 Tax=Lacipirellula parvula TaxID=2650471 RepID=UPI0012606FCE|nr:hypothetical protein [Lacipirellula parvula]